MQVHGTVTVLATSAEHSVSTRSASGSALTTGSIARSASLNGPASGVPAGQTSLSSPAQQPGATLSSHDPSQVAAAQLTYQRPVVAHTLQSSAVPSAIAGATEHSAQDSDQPAAPSRDGKAHSASEGQQASDDALAEIRQLASRDREVRQHEAGHAAVGGQYAGAPRYEYQRGPDGRLYAVAGEVSIDTSPVLNDPAATLEKAEVILRAALAVAEPSAQDRAVAARASALAAEARAELAQLARTERETSVSGEPALPSEPSAAEKQREEQQAQKEKQGDSLQDYSATLQEVNQRLAEVHQRLIDAGVFSKLFPEGLLVDRRV